jgi:beta-glucuronidase
MKSPNRRRFLSALPLAAAPAAAPSQPASGVQADVTLDGLWQFQAAGRDWVEVTVPHTWQVMAGYENHRGKAAYRRSFDVPAAWNNSVVRIEFESVFHTAVVSVNGQPAGRHEGLGYTAFAFDITKLLKFGAENEVTVEVDNAFYDRMLPRGNSSDWAHDGGIYRPVHLHVTPKNFIRGVAIEAVPNLATGSASVEVTAAVEGAGRLSVEVRDLTSQRTVLSRDGINAQGPGFRLPDLPIAKARLWHFDTPHLYELALTLESAAGVHTLTETFGVRQFEVRDGAFYLNGERIRLAGVERMAGSHPEYGMAEPAHWIDHDHRDMKELNCMFTRVHWQQDRRVLDFCDREGIMVQLEVPTWGQATFNGMGPKPDNWIVQNGLGHMREMVARDRNHPSVVMWGCCNEIGGQRPADAGFAEAMYNEAKRLDPRRPRTYASYSLRQTPEKDISRIMEAVEVNEYFESWNGGAIPDLVKMLDGIRDAFPRKPIVISEYGYCACKPEWPEGDAKRRRIMATHAEVFRQRPEIAGIIFFCYNDYRTHVGDRGVDRLQQRVHGVVDVYGRRKKSFESLRRELSPVESVRLRYEDNKLQVVVKNRDTLPAYTLRGYTLRALFEGPGPTMLERLEAPIPDLAPGALATLTLAPASAKTPLAICADVLRPNGWSAFTETWRP